MNIRKIIARTLLLGGLIVATVTAEQVGKVSYKGQPETLNGTVVDVPNGSVAMSEEIYVGIPDELLEGGSDINANPFSSNAFNKVGSALSDLFPTLIMVEDKVANSFSCSSISASVVEERSNRYKIKEAVCIRSRAR